MQIIFNLENGQLKFLDNFYLLSTIYSWQERVNSVLNVKAVVAAFNQEKAIVGAFSVITNLRMELFEALVAARGQHSGGVTAGRRTATHGARQLMTLDLNFGQKVRIVSSHAHNNNNKEAGAQVTTLHSMLPLSWSLFLNSMIFNIAIVLKLEGPLCS